MVRAYLETHRDEIEIADTGLAAFVCVTAVEALIHAAVAYRAEVVSDERVTGFVDEVTRLVLRYLKVRLYCSPIRRSVPVHEWAVGVGAHHVDVGAGGDVGGLARAHFEMHRYVFDLLIT
jgi:hypothetical protein